MLPSLGYRTDVVLRLVTGLLILYVLRNTLLTAMRLGLQGETQICGRITDHLRLVVNEHINTSWSPGFYQTLEGTSVTFSLLFYYVRPYPRKSGMRENVSAKLPKGPFFYVFHGWGCFDEARLAEVRHPSTSSHLVVISPVLPVSCNPS